MKRVFTMLWTRQAVALLLSLFAVLIPTTVRGDTHYDAGYESCSIVYASDSMDLCIENMRIWNYQGNNSHFYDDPLVKVTVNGEGTHSFNLCKLYSIYSAGEGDENPFKTTGGGTGDFRNSASYNYEIYGIKVKAFFSNHTFETTVSGSNNGNNSDKWCTADLTIRLYSLKKATIQISGKWRDASDGVNDDGEGVNWTFTAGYPYVDYMSSSRCPDDNGAVQLNWRTSENTGTWEVWRGSTFLAAVDGNTKSYIDRNRCGTGEATYYVTYRTQSTQNTLPNGCKGVYESSTVTLHHYYTEFTYNNDASALQDGTRSRHCRYCNTEDTWSDPNHPKWTYAVQTESGTECTVSDSLAPDGITYTVTATPCSGYVFGHWHDGTNVYTDNPLIYTMTGNTTLTAYFNVGYTRTMTNEWGTLVLPYGVNYDASNTNYKLYYLSGAAFNGNEGTLTFTEYATGTIDPCTPMVVKAIGNRNDEGLYEIIITGNGTYSNIIYTTDAVNGFSMHGTFDERSNQTGMYFIAQNAFWHAETPITIGANRTWLTYSGTSAPARFSIVEAQTGVVTETPTGSPCLGGEVRAVKVMIDGRMYILRGEKLYDMNGRAAGKGLVRAGCSLLPMMSQ